MSVLNSLEPRNVFKYFEEISKIPRGSGNMAKISKYCVDFAKSHSLKYIRDKWDNVIVFKSATKGYETAEPIILQAHLDIVCQKTAESEIDFSKDGLEIYIDGEFIKAKETTLGADNGIAVAMILAILESDNIAHPAIEAVFTTDEEIGLIGASNLDMSVLKSKRMINLDSEDIDCATVSCAGGSEFTAIFTIAKEAATGIPFKITLKGLKGGHSGICINDNRVNANILAGRFLDYLNKNTAFSLISINGGDKSNAIPLLCEIDLMVTDENEFIELVEKFKTTVKEELFAKEPDFSLDYAKCENFKEVFTKEFTDKLIFALLLAPNGVQEMSAEIEGLVETSLNLGILKTDTDKVALTFALRSNKKSALLFLEQKLYTCFKTLNATISTCGHYPPWEYNSNSKLQEIYKKTYAGLIGKPPRVEAIHAGLECGIFADAIEGFDGIAIGPQMYDVHTVNEKLDIASVGEIYKILIKILEKCR